MAALYSTEADDWTLVDEDGKVEDLIMYSHLIHAHVHVACCKHCVCVCVAVYLYVMFLFLFRCGFRTATPTGL